MCGYSLPVDDKEFIDPSESFAVHRQGVDVRAATNAVQEAAVLLEQASQSGDVGDVSPHITGKPLTCGSVALPGGRWRVVYRMVGQMIVFVVVPPACNAYAALDVLEKAVRIVTNECKTTDTNPDKLEKRYPEVYMALGALLSSGGILSSGAAMRDGRALVETIANMGKHDKDKGGDKGGDTSKTLAGAPQPTKGTKRSLADHAALLPGMLGFNTEAGLAGVKPLPGWELQHAVPATVPKLARHQFEVMPQAPVQVAPEAPPPADDEDDPFAFIKAPLAAKEAPKPAAPMPIVPPSSLLRLSEVWEAEVEGSDITRARLQGSVSWVPELASATVPAIPFCLSLDGPVPHSKGSSEAEELLMAALGRAHAHSTMSPFQWPAATQPPVPSSGVEPGTPAFVADVRAAKSQLAPVLLRYIVPAVQAPLPVPMQVRLGVSLQPAGDGAMQTVVMVGVQLKFAQELDASAVQGIEVRLVVPSLFELPSRVFPAGATMDGAKHTIVWKHGASLERSTEAQSFSAVFLVSAGETATKAALRGLSAEVNASGAHSATLTGVTLHQYGFDGAACRDACTWATRVRARLALDM